MPYYIVELGPIPVDKMSEFHEFCEAYALNISKVEFHAGKRPPKSKRKSSSKKQQSPRVRRYVRDPASLWVLSNKGAPSRGDSLAAYNAINKAHPKKRPFTYKEAKEAIQAGTKLGEHQSSDARKNLVTHGYMRSVK